MRKKVSYIPLREILYKVFEKAEYKISQKLAKETSDSICMDILEILYTDKEAVVSLPKLGRFSLVNVEARKGRNPKNGEALEIPEHSRIKFKVSALSKKG